LFEVLSTALSCPNPYSLIQDIFFNFLWNNKVEKVKRNTVIGNYEDGGLKMPHVLSFVHALNISWITNLLFQRKLKKISWIFLTICIGGSDRTVKG
jgi:hypothetical protein